MSKAPKTLSNCQKRAETSVVLIVFDCVLCQVRAYKLVFQFCDYPHFICISFRQFYWYIYIIL